MRRSSRRRPTKTCFPRSMRPGKSNQSPINQFLSSKAIAPRDQFPFAHVQPVFRSRRFQPEQRRCFQSVSETPVFCLPHRPHALNCICQSVWLGWCTMKERGSVGVGRPASASGAVRCSPRAMVIPRCGSLLWWARQLSMWRDSRQGWRFAVQFGCSMQQVLSTSHCCRRLLFPCVVLQDALHARPTPVHHASSVHDQQVRGVVLCLKLLILM